MIISIHTFVGTLPLLQLRLRLRLRLLLLPLSTPILHLRCILRPGLEREGMEKSWRKNKQHIPFGRLAPHKSLLTCLRRVRASCKVPYAGFLLSVFFFFLLFLGCKLSASLRLGGGLSGRGGIRMAQGNGNGNGNGREPDMGMDGFFDD